MNALRRNGYSTREDELHGAYAAKRLPRRTVWIPNLGFFANRRSAAAACLAMAAGFRRAAARGSALPEARALWLERAREWVDQAREHGGEARPCAVCESPIEADNLSDVCRDCLAIEGGLVQDADGWLVPAPGSAA